MLMRNVMTGEHYVYAHVVAYGPHKRLSVKRRKRAVCGERWLRQAR